MAKTTHINLALEELAIAQRALEKAKEQMVRSVADSLIEVARSHTNRANSSIHAALREGKV